jgi:hypothetical protein
MREESLKAAVSEPPKRERGYMVRGERAFMEGMEDLYQIGNEHQHH